MSVAPDSPHACIGNVYIFRKNTFMSILFEVVLTI